MYNGPRWKAVIFDFDGVIADSEPIHYRAVEEALQPWGLSHSYEEYVDRYLGLDDRDLFHQAFDDAGRDWDPARLPRIMAAKLQAFKRIAPHGLRAFPGVKTLIESMTAKGIALAIGSGSSRQEIDLMLTALGLRHHFPIIVSADLVSQSKPSPETYLLALERLTASYPNQDFRPRNCLVIEDTPTGIEAAKRAGLQVLGVGHSRPVTELTGADFTARSLERLEIESLGHLP